MELGAVIVAEVVGGGEVIVVLAVQQWIDKTLKSCEGSLVFLFSEGIRFQNSYVTKYNLSRRGIFMILCLAIINRN